MCEAHESEAPVYSLTYQPSRQEIRLAGCALFGYRSKRTPSYLAIGFLAVSNIINFSHAAYHGSLHLGFVMYNLVMLLLVAAVIVIVTVAAPEQLHAYMRDRKGDAGRTQTYTLCVNFCEGLDAPNENLYVL